ncbi:MAG: glycosyltransferase family 2 protein [Candidatus Hodarchaeales archaeon]|jgi:GT2 family glycosyltransferase
MNITVIIPVVNSKLATSLLRNIENNTLLPKEVIIVDNNPGNKLFRFDTDKFLISYYYTKSKRLNESWEVARQHLSDSCEYVSFLNDDIIIGDWFFQRVYETFLVNQKCGVACPRTCFSEDITKGRINYHIMNKRDACAFTIRRGLLDKIPPIPYKKLTTFHGDDWIWTYVHKFGFNWMQDLGNPVFHHVGVSILRLGFRRLKRKERNIWLAMEKEGL